MRELFKKLKGLSLEDGTKLIRTSFDVNEVMNQDSKTTCDFDFMVNENDYFHYRTTMEAVQDDAPDVDTENGYWGMMLDDNHETHT